MTIITHQKSIKLILEPEDNQRLAALCGQYNQNLHQIEKYLHVEIHNRGNEFQIAGTNDSTKKAEQILHRLFNQTKHEKNLTAENIHFLLRGISSSQENAQIHHEQIRVHTPKMAIMPHTHNQANYINNIFKHDVNFGVGPAGTGKTYLAVACAVAALEKEEVDRIVLVRPVVEAGEHLGFLPGDISQKIDPYLRPLYDALYDMLGSRQVEKLIAEHVIEIAPLAFMRGRTLNSAFIILDESQNTTIEQMKMFLTRIGFGSKVVVTGDVTQIDLAKDRKSGLIHVIDILQNVAGISFTYFVAQDVVRHPLVQNIIQAYERAKEKDENDRQKKLNGVKAKT